MSEAPRGLQASVQARLVRHAKQTGMDPNFVLTRFAVERFLYRLSRSAYADRFVLKGALLMLVWLGETVRPTRDADMLGFGEITEQSLTTIFTEVCNAEVELDGIEFVVSSLHIAPIRIENAYSGLRAVLQARLGNARLQVQVDVGIGDAISPEPVWLEYPTLLDFPRPRLRAYRPETAIAEKFHAMVTLGEANSRMKDYFDIYALAQHEHFTGHVLSDALRATFDRRRTPMPGALPLAITPSFAAIPQKQLQWQGFLRRSGALAAPAELSEIVAGIALFLEPVIVAACGGSALVSDWPPGGTWRHKSC